jgi:hypothetical protein
MSIARVVIGLLVAVVIIGAFVIQRYAFWLIFTLGPTPPTLAHNSARWKRIEDLLGQVLDLREGSERTRKPKVRRLLALNSARRGGSTRPATSATKPKKRAR